MLKLSHEQVHKLIKQKMDEGIGMGYKEWLDDRKPDPVTGVSRCQLITRVMNQSYYSHINWKEYQETLRKGITPETPGRRNYPPGSWQYAHAKKQERKTKPITDEELHQRVSRVLGIIGPRAGAWLRSKAKDPVSKQSSRNIYLNVAYRRSFGHPDWYNYVQEHHKVKLPEDIVKKIQEKEARANLREEKRKNTLQKLSRLNRSKGQKKPYKFSQKELAEQVRFMQTYLVESYKRKLSDIPPRLIEETAKNAVANALNKLKILYTLEPETFGKYATDLIEDEIIKAALKHRGRI